MKFINKCCISLDEIDSDEGLLVKVPAPYDRRELSTCSYISSWLFNRSELNNKSERDIYYYIADEATLDQLHGCPITRRTGTYYVVKLSSLRSNQISSLLDEQSDDKLVDDNKQLKMLSKNFPWEEKIFPRGQINNATQNNTANLRRRNDEFIWPLLDASATATLGAFLTLLAQNYFEAEYILFPEFAMNPSAHIRAAAYVLAITAASAGMGYKLSDSGYSFWGLFYPAINRLTSNADNRFAEPPFAQLRG